MGGHCISSACREPSVLFSGHIIDHECCLISEVHLRNEHVHPSPISSSVNDSCKRMVYVHQHQFDGLFAIFKLRQKPMHGLVDCVEFQRHVRCGSSQKTTMSAVG